MPQFAKLLLLVLVALDSLGPAPRHSLQFGRVSVKLGPFAYQVEAHKDWIDSTKRKYVVANLLAKFVRHRANVKLPHERDCAVGRGDAHALRVDANEHLADLVEGCRMNRHNWHRVVQ